MIGTENVGDDLCVIVVHNRYRSAQPSGENRAVDRDIALLRDSGVRVLPWIRSSDEIDAMPVWARPTVPLRAVWSPPDVRAVAELIDRQRPQVLHLHNLYPLISPAVIRLAKRRGLAVVQSVHNYRHSCLNGLHLRRAETCTRCVGHRVAWDGVRFGCYRGSRLQSAGLAAAEALHQGTWRLVDRFLALGDFMAGQLVAAGLPREKVVVKENFVDDPGPPGPPGRGFLFAGRLEEAKGLRLLLDAWARSGLDGEVPLVVAGDGPMRAEATSRAAGLRSVEICGPLDAEAIAGRFRACAAVVVPSLCFEGPPSVILEAYAHGRPVLATRFGANAEAVTPATGWLAEPRAGALAAALVAARRPDQARAGAARHTFTQRFTRQRARDRLLGHYRACLR